MELWLMWVIAVKIYIFCVAAMVIAYIAYVFGWTDFKFLQRKKEKK